MEEGDLGNNSPVSKKSRRDEGEALPVKEEQPPPSSSSSDAHGEPHSCSHNDDGGDDHREEEEDDGGQSAGSVFQESQVMGEKGRALSRVPDPQAQKVDPTSDEMGETCRDITPATAEFQAAQHGHSEHLDSENGVFNSENAIMSSTLGGIPELPTRNLPADQSILAFTNVRDPVSTYAVQQSNYNLPKSHSPNELRLKSYLPQNHGLQTQMADGFVLREQLVGWLHLQQQFAMHDPTILSRSQDLQGQGYSHRDAIVPSNGTYTSGAPPFVQFPSNVSQKGVGAYNMPSSIPMSFDAVPVPATFANTVLPNLEVSHLADGGDPFGPVQMNTGYIDLVQPSCSQQLDAGLISPVQVDQAGHNRTLVLNSIYDPMYEALGQPVDPHMRLFLANRHDWGQFHKPQHTAGS